MFQAAGVIVVEENVVGISPGIEEFGVGSRLVSEQAVFLFAGFPISEKVLVFGAFGQGDGIAKRSHDVVRFAGRDLDGIGCRPVRQWERLIFLVKSIAGFRETFGSLLRVGRAPVMSE